MKINTFIIQQNDFSSHDNVFLKVSEIITTVRNESMDIVPILFDGNIDYIDPLFLVLILAEQKKDINIKYAFDTISLKDFQQGIIQHFFRQQIDLKKFNIETKDTKSPYYEVFLEDNPIERFERYRILKINKNTIFSMRNESQYAISFRNDKDYQLLPIMQLRGLPHLEPRCEHRILPDDIEPLERRKTYYSRVALQGENLLNLNEFQKYLNYTVEDFLNFLGLGSKNLSTPLGNIFYELLDNIRKHTDDHTNGYFSFSKIEKGYKENKYYEYQLIIADNGENGVLQTYKSVLEKELDNLKLVVDSKLLTDYEDTIEKLSSINQENDIEILKVLYDIANIAHVHQIPRVAMHFGLPLLLKMIHVFVEKNDYKKKSSNKNILEVYTHSGDNFYKVYYDSNGKYHEPITRNDNIKGTYVVLTFTDQISAYEDVHLEVNSNSLVKNVDYKTLLSSEDIHSRLNQYQFVPIKNLEEFEEIDITTKNIIFGFYDEHITFSEFIRKLYLFAYQNNLVDIVVVNVNLDTCKPHLELIAQITYEGIEKPYDYPRNILFYNNKFPSSVFVGGKDKKEFLVFADALKKYYGFDASLGLHSTDDIEVSSNTDMNTSLIYEKFIFPFELFSYKDHSLYDFDVLQDMINNYLYDTATKEKLDIHIDTHVGYHINKFFDIRSIFEDSRWVKRLAFKLAKKLDALVSDSSKKLFLVGIDSYTNMLISLAVKYLDSHQPPIISGYEIYNIHDSKERERIEIELKKRFEKKGGEKNKKNTNEQVVLISSATYKGARVSNLLEEIGSANVPHIVTIRLMLDNDADIPNTDNDIVTFRAGLVDNEDKFKIEETYCAYCKGRKIPLLELDQNDPFLIKDTYFGLWDEQSSNEHYPLPSSDVNWAKSFYFGHIERGTNHFLYYIDTIRFFKNNEPKIRKFLNKYKDKDVFKSSAKRKTLILAPSHNTHNNFISLVNEIMFDNESIVLYFDKSKGEDNFHRLSSYWFDREDIELKVFFVDDSIASGYTLEYFYTILKKIPGFEGDGFDGVLLLLDRMSDTDKMIVSNYIKNSDDIYAFAQYEVKPIKTEVETCFLCKRSEEYLDLMTKSALDLTIFKMADKALKIRKTDYSYYDLNSDVDEDRVKTFIKALAADYIHRKFHRKFAENIEDQNGYKKIFQNLYQEFVEEIKRLMSDQFEKFVTYVGENFINEFIEFEAEIALIKVMSFPKVSYYYDVRKEAIGYIVGQINSAFKDMGEIDFTKKIISVNSRKTTVFTETYQKKTYLHRLNAYFSVLGYFRDPILLKKECIELYFQATQKKEQFEDNEVFHAYPFAVKMTISDNIEKSRFFEANLKSVEEKYKREEYKFGVSKWALFDALYLENTLFDRSEFVTLIKQQKDYKDIKKVRGYFKILKNQQLEGKLKYLKKDITTFIDVQDDGIMLYIYPHLSKKFSDYQNYLSSAENEMIDLFGDFSSIANMEDAELKNNVKTIFYGAVEKKETDQNKTDKIELRRYTDSNDINDTWANIYHKGYTIIRLVKVDKEKLFDECNQRNTYKENNNLWFKPIGCLVVPHEDEARHLEIVRKILAIRYELVNFIDDELSHGMIQEVVEKKTLNDILIGYNHTTASMLDLGSQLEFIKSELAEKMQDKSFEFSKYSGIDQLVDYTYGVSKIGKVAHLLKKPLVESANKSVYDILIDVNDKMKKFFKSAYEMHKTKTEIDIKLDKSLKNINLPLSEDSIEIVFFELFFNAAKYGNPTDGNRCNVSVYCRSKSIYIDNDTIATTNTNNGLGTAHGYLKEIFRKIGYKFDSSMIEDRRLYRVIISQEVKYG